MGEESQPTDRKKLLKAVLNAQITSKGKARVDEKAQHTR